MNVMPIEELIQRVVKICRRNGVRRLDLFGSFATGTALPTSDIDFVVYGCSDILKLEKDLEEIREQLLVLENYSKLDTPQIGQTYTAYADVNGRYMYKANYHPLLKIRYMYEGIVN